MLDDWRSAPIDQRLRAILAFIEKLTLEPESVGPADAAELRRSGISAQAIEDAIHVCTLFNVYDRLADAFEFHIPDARGFQQSAAMLLKRGYV